MAAPDVAMAMQLLAEDHDYVVVDAPSKLGEETLAMLDVADIILLVVTYSQASIANTRAAVHTLNRPVVGEIPTDWKLVQESLNKQQPFVLSSPNAPVSKAMDALANSLVQQQRR